MFTSRLLLRPAPLGLRSFATSASSPSSTVILGTGWGGFNLARALASAEHPVTIISPSNHFLFTPLLPSTTVGTLEFRVVQETIRGSTWGKHVTFYQAKARSIDMEKRVIEAEGIFDKESFEVPYSKLVMSQGVKTNTFGTPGVEEREGKEVFFLKHLHHARGIRNRTLELFEQAAFPNTPDDEKRRLLTFVVVGAGPTSCEYASELGDFVHEDIARMYPDLLQFVSLELIEAGAEVLSSFDASLKKYIARLFEERKISVRTATAVKAVEVFTKAAYRHEATKAVLSDGKEIEFGLMVWSAGLQPVKFTARTDFEKTPQGRVVVDEYLRVKGHEGTVWACDDCAQIEGFPLPQLAQVAQQQGEYIAEVLSARKGETDKEWHYFSLGSMMSAGFGAGVYDGSAVGDPKGWHGSLPFNLQGVVAWLAWRSAYWGKQVSLENKLLIPMYWFKAWAFGRSTARF
ncbi:hypothetical protein TeGR_g3456 [Tetraparma gracilis]|uniref:FAD/NAD(P)-binding domain-containing protein n=1 Tax=Tetraparma gracilis TaxID=2962635 RepID=A0ABQ6MZX1_9STRA|nr:hypothetical protein TeGR_g3456 [Tetraparma gracilis]